MVTFPCRSLLESEGELAGAPKGQVCLPQGSCACCVGLGQGWNELPASIMCLWGQGNLCGVAVRSVDTWGQVALLLCLTKDPAQGATRPSQSSNSAFQGGSTGDPHCVHCMGTLHSSIFPAPDSSFFLPHPKTLPPIWGQRTMESKRAALERP